ncbi:MAG: SpoIIE family protein phosphatase [Candidatus Brocadiaceae bacterium]|nr:SpoIIE family protein phosphatase [Candidatus Brocadiaceae bacterium]
MFELSKCTVLVVDDTEANIDILVAALDSEYEVSVAMDGENALEIVNTDPPDLILLDIMMPSIDGYEVCRRLKSEPKTSGIPIIFITAMSEIENKTKGLELGAVDYITKPFEAMEVKARVKTHLSLTLARRELANQNIILEEKVRIRTEALKQSITARERMKSELRIAHDIQMNIMPVDFPPFPDKPEIDIHAILKPAKEVGGDFYDFFFISPDRLCLVVGDVSGKGVPAALFMSMVITYIRSIAKVFDKPDLILDNVNREITRGNDSCTFVTVFLGILNIKTGELSYTNAGHNPPLKINVNNGVTLLDDANCPAIGMDDDFSFSEKTIMLKSLDMICICTDGVTEAFDEKEEMFSEERLIEEVYKHREYTAGELADEIFQKVQSFSEKMPQADDITILNLRYLP